MNRKEFIKNLSIFSASSIIFSSCEEDVISTLLTKSELADLSIDEAQQFFNTNYLPLYLSKSARKLSKSYERNANWSLAKK